ncbi:MAG: ArgE/DapE family deacylase [Arenicellales bacterium]|nr:ArgE/DapE family deacylase [Arenicellales bacterium]
MFNSEHRRELIESVDETRLTNTLIEMISIKSENPFKGDPRPGFREKEMGEYYLEHMHQLGMDVSQREVVPGRPNVFGKLKGNGKGNVLMLSGHLDTVPTEGYESAYDVKVADGKVYGRGACDMKAGLAAYLEAVRIVRDAGIKLQGDLILCGVVDEEYLMIGSKEIGANGPQADQGIIGEPSELTICPANKGQLSTFIRTYGRAVHSSIPEQGVNAIKHMARVIDAFEDYNEELARRDPHPLCGHARFSPGVIRGGELVTAVPDYCELEVDRRTLPGETNVQVFDEYRRRLNLIAQRDPTFRYEITNPSWDIPPNDISIDEPVVQSLLRNHQILTGITSTPVAFPGGTDAPNMGFPNVVCGPGSIAQAHTTNEYVEVDQIVLAARMYLAVILDLLEVRR